MLHFKAFAVRDWRFTSVSGWAKFYLARVGISPLSFFKYGGGVGFFLLFCFFFLLSFFC